MSTSASSDRTGSCLCKAVQYEISGPPLQANICHCKNCQKWCGSAFTSFGAYAKTSVKITSGESSLKTYDDTATTHGSVMKRTFCSNCGTPIFAENSANPGGMVVATGSMDDKEGWDWVPEREIFCSNREPWLPTIEGTTKIDRMPSRG